jgi:hypothetical protein
VVQKVMGKHGKGRGGSFLILVAAALLVLAAVSAENSTSSFINNTGMVTMNFSELAYGTNDSAHAIPEDNSVTEIMIPEQFMDENMSAVETKNNRTGLVSFNFTIVTANESYINKTKKTISEEVENETEDIPIEEIPPAEEEVEEHPIEIIPLVENKTPEATVPIEQANETEETTPEPTLEPTATFKNKAGQAIGVPVITEVNGTYTIEITPEQPAGLSASSTAAQPRVVLAGVQSPDVTVQIDSYDQPISADILISTDVVAVNDIDIESAVIELPTLGQVNTILRCDDFDQDMFTCASWETTQIPFERDGNIIRFTVDHFSGYAGGEIIAIDAVHLDENYAYISNIYDDVQWRDNMWSEPIYEHEIVRVTFETNLTNGRMIDFFARSNGTIAYVDIYESGTMHKVAQSGSIGHEQLQFMEVNGLTKPTDVFDFKIVKVVQPAEEVQQCIVQCTQECSSDNTANCTAECNNDCATPTADEDRTAFIEFDFIHDDIINATQADGLLAYGKSGSATPRYRLWNSSNNFTVELNDAFSIGADGTDDPVWVVVRANHERNEIIMGTEDGTTNDINFQVYHENESWGTLTEIATGIQNSAQRAFDIGIEDISGDALVMYETSSTADTTVAYRIWNGSQLSAQNTVSTGLASSPVRWVSLVPRAGHDDIMALILTTANDLHAHYWNGSGFELERNITLNTGVSSVTEENFAFAWERTSNQGFVAYAQGNNYIYRTFSLTAPFWSTEVSEGFGNSIDSIRLCSEPTSDYIGAIFQDGGNDVNVRMWDGTQILASPPSQDAQTEAQGANSANADCAWYNSSHALFTFVDQNELFLDYFTFTKSNTWSTADLTSTSTTSGIFTTADDIQGVRFVEHPTTEEIMITLSDLDSIGYTLRWNGTTFVRMGESPVEATMEVNQGDQEGIMFDWFRFDPVPNVTTPNISSKNFPTLNTVIQINVTILDNIAVETVLANITLPNSTIRQIQLINTSGNNTFYNNTFDVTDLNGEYTLLIIANDTSNHQNVNKSSYTFSMGDIIKPNVTNITPSSLNFNLNAVINITANVTDEINISIVRANITLPNGTIEQVTLNNITRTNDSQFFNNTFNITSIVGTYTIRIFANDTVNNINNSETVTFTVGDIIFPNVTNISPNNANFEVSSTINISVNVTEETNLDTVLANITLPNGTIRQITLGNLTPIHFNSTFSVTDTLGTYTLRIIVNDSTNNVNSSETTTFTVGDTLPPAVTSLTPTAYSNFSANPAVNLSAIVTDAGAVSVVEANVTLPNGTVRVITLADDNSNSVYNATFSVTDLEGTYNVTVFANDSENNINSTQQTSFIVDLQPPVFVSLTTSPSSAADLDPNANVTVFANISENVTVVSSAILQYRLTNETDDNFVNVTLLYNSGDELFNSSFNATRNGTYALRLWANDSAGNQDVSNHVNITVEVDRNWTRTPSEFAIVTGSLDENVSLGNLTINNTGDVDIYFNITSDSALTRYNTTENFSLTAGEVKFINVMDNSTVNGLKTITLNITVNDSTVTPQAQTTRGRVVVSGGQPVLSATFTTPTEEAISIERGSTTSTEFAATLTNLGIGNASNVSFIFTFPPEWTITFGTTTDDIGDFNSGDDTAKNIRITVPSNFSTGDVYVYANATGVNNTGANLTTENFTFGDQVQVTITAPAAALGSGNTGGGGGSSSSSSAPAAATGGGGVSFKAAGGVSETIQTTKAFRIVRGSGDSVPLTITNLYENSIMQNIKLDAFGFLSQYVVISPPINFRSFNDLDVKNNDRSPFTVSHVGEHHVTINQLFTSSAQLTVESNPQELTVYEGKVRYVDLDGDGIGDAALELTGSTGTRGTLRIYELMDERFLELNYGDGLNYALDVHAPPYLVQSDYNITLRIRADVVPLNSKEAGFSRNSITEFRTLLFKIHELGLEEATTNLDQAYADVRAMADAGFNVVEINRLLQQAQLALDAENFEGARELSNRINSIKETAFEGRSVIVQVQKLIAKAQSQWLETPQTIDALELAQRAFERGDYTTALERAKNAQLQFVLETKGRINILWFLRTYWWAVLLALAFVLSLLYFVYKKAQILIIGQRLQNLDKEQETIGKLLRETQKKYLEDQLISSSQFDRYKKHYEKRLVKIDKIRIHLRNKRIVIMRTQHALAGLKNEKKQLHELMKKDQHTYLIEGKMGRQEFIEKYEDHKARLAEVEHEETVLEEKLSKKVKQQVMRDIQEDERKNELIIRKKGKEEAKKHATIEKNRELKSNKKKNKKDKQKEHTLKNKRRHKQQEIENSKEDTHHIIRIPHPVHEMKKIARRINGYKNRARSQQLHKQHSHRQKRRARTAKKAATPYDGKWVTIRVGDTKKLLADKFDLDLPVQQKEVSRTFSEYEVEAFNQELLRMAQYAQKEQLESGNAMTFVDKTVYQQSIEEKKKKRFVRSFDKELLNIARTTAEFNPARRMTVEELKKWYPGAFE